MNLYSSTDYTFNCNTAYMPFNRKEMKQSFPFCDSCFDDTLSRRLGRTGSTVKVSGAVGRAIQRMAISDMNTQAFNFGGFAVTEETALAVYDFETGKEYNAAGRKAGSYEVEYDGKNDGKIVILYNYASGDIKATVLQDGTAKPYVIDISRNRVPGAHSASALIEAYLVRCIYGSYENEHQEDIGECFRSSYAKLLRTQDNEERAKYAAALSEDFYQMYSYPNKVLAAFGTVLISESPAAMPMIAEEDVRAFTAQTYLRRTGNPIPDLQRAVSLQNASVQTVAGGDRHKPVRSCTQGEFSPDPARILDESEKQMVYSLREGDIVPEQALYCSELIRSTHDASQLWKFILAEPSSTGKSKFCDFISYLTGLPIVRFGCSPDTDRNQLTLDLIPNASGEGEGMLSLQKFLASAPSAEEMVFNPLGSYERITGETKPEATASDCRDALASRVSEIASRQAGGFRYVYSPLVQAMKYGWICEIQEPTVIQRPGTLAALNMMFDDSKTIRLLNGEEVHRHPDTVVIITTNVDYEGCSDLNQSVFSRFFPISLPMPDDDVLLARLKGQSGFEDEKVLKKMLKVYHSCLEYA
ncbi:MAG: AAA family ATPase, partial [Solobacterium sp.]|nr:AAA family ATPase [Solobacterium sp.]